MSTSLDGGRPGRRTALKTLLALGAGAFTGSLAYGCGWARHQVAVTRTDLPVAGLPAALDGVRIALLTDFHCSSTVRSGDISRAVQLANDAAPDLVILGGDYVTLADTDYIDQAADLLSAARGRHGVYAVLGNHDGDRETTAALEKRSIQVLRDERTSLRVNGARIDLVGIRYWTRRAADIARLRDPLAPATILLAHDPRRFADAAALGIPLVLSGHTHGGQVVIPGLGAPAARRFPVVAGPARLRQTTLFVSRGIGTVYLPVRLNCPPEVCVLTLRPDGGVA